MRAAIAHNGSFFTAQRMVAQSVETPTAHHAADHLSFASHEKFAYGTQPGGRVWLAAKCEFTRDSSSARRFVLLQAHPRARPCRRIPLGAGGSL